MFNCCMQSGLDLFCKYLTEDCHEVWLRIGSKNKINYTHLCAIVCILHGFEFVYLNVYFI
jgi:hypothetical protein